MLPGEAENVGEDREVGEVGPTGGVRQGLEKVGKACVLPAGREAVV